MMKQGLVAWTWETHGRFAAGGEGSCGERCPRPRQPRPATAHSTLIPETMMADWAGALKPGPAGHRRCRGGCGLDRAGPGTWSVSPADSGHGGLLWTTLRRFGG